jgi:hypothetical protein
MKLQRVVSLACLICLVLASTLSAQDDPVAIKTEQVVRLYAKDLPAEVDLQAYLSSGAVKLTNGLQCTAPQIVPGPAPAPYPQAVIWEKGFEQLGPTSVTCDGMWFINGNLWQPNKIALIMWKIRIPKPSKRLASEFERDLTLSLWVDSNEDKAWTKNERIIGESFNLHNLFPNRWSVLEIWYLTCFKVPGTPKAVQQGGGKTVKYETKFWVRGAVSYDDPDVSPTGEFLFGEVEDYQINYFEIRRLDKNKG